MDRPLFSDMLVERRRQLGLSIKQASNVLRLKEEVLIAFEEGDFDSIPKSGYAQGMLSSYARYLGLNAKTVVNQFSTDLFEHERGAGSHEARRRSRQNRNADDGPLYETPQANAIGRSGNRTYVESHGFLPTSGGFAGDMGDFATTSSPRPRYSSGGSSSEQSDPYPQGRPYTSRIPVSTNLTPLGQAQRQRPSSRSGHDRQDAYGRTSRYADARDDVTTRRVMPSQYRDDMRLDNDGGSYQSASSTVGRRSSRNIASTQRPNVRRRSGSDERARIRNRDHGNDVTYGGLLGMIQVFFQDRSRVIGLIIGLLAIILTGTIIFSVSSCISARQSTGRSVTVTSTDEQTSEDENTDEMTDAEEQRARDEAAAAKAAETEESATERTIEVTVADGEVTWLEIEYDGRSDIAETVTGPWNRTYTVRQQISINVNDTTAVTVTEDGKTLEFDSKASGIGTITIQVSKKGSTNETTDANGATTGETQDGAGTQSTDQTTQTQTTDPNQQQMADPNQQGQNATGQGQTAPTSGSPYEGYTLDADGYYYGADGYYDAAGNFYSY